jgi:hypothetical protein
MCVVFVCRQMLAAGPPGVVGCDLEWRPSFTKGAPPNKAALIQLAYACKVCVTCHPPAGQAVACVAACVFADEVYLQLIKA